METKRIIELRQAAERSVSDMADSSLKAVAFQTAFSELLRQEFWLHSPKYHMGGGARSAARKNDIRPRGNGTTVRLLSLKDEGFFSEPQSLADVRRTLSERGWRYRPQDLGTPLTRLVRSKQLKRIQTIKGRKKTWTYCNY